MSEGVKAAGDLASGVVVIGTLMQILPSIAALLTVIWAALRVYEIILSIRIKRKELGE